MDTETARDALRQLIARADRASGQVEGDTFRLHPKARRRAVSVTLYGRIAPDRDGTLISAWAFPQWLMIISFAVWVWICIYLAHALWMVVVGFCVGVFSFVAEARRGYDLLREIYVI